VALAAPQVQVLNLESFVRHRASSAVRAP
jgi:hypothetical protein